MNNQSIIKNIIPFLVLLLLMLSAVGCFDTENNDANNNNTNQTANENAAKEKVTLYFGDKEAMHLIAEERELVLDGRSLEVSVIEALIAGPESPELSKTIPDETRLLSVKIEEGTAYVDFSQELQTKHWGGSAGELMTIYSVTNSLSELPEVDRVQFLLKGEKQESIFGHMDTSEPIEPNWDLVKD